MRDGRAVGSDCGNGQYGQALVEAALLVPILLLLMFGLIDFGRALYDLQVMTNLSREGSNLASRGTDLTSAAAAVAGDASVLNWNAQGCVIVTAITNNNGTNQISGQVARGCSPGSSKIGQGVGSAARLPAAVPALPPTGETVYATEVFYRYQALTPLGALLGFALPSTLYDVAYF